MNEPVFFKDPSVKRYSEDEIQAICSFALRNYHNGDKDLYRQMLNDILQETRHMAIYPPFNVFKDVLCENCRCRYHRPEYQMCLECASFKRTENLNKFYNAEKIQPVSD